MTKNRVKCTYFQRNTKTWATETRKSPRFKGLKTTSFERGITNIRITTVRVLSLPLPGLITSQSNYILLSLFNRRGSSDPLKGSDCSRCPLTEHSEGSLHGRKDPVGFTLHSSMCMLWGSPLLHQQYWINSIMAWASIPNSSYPLFCSCFCFQHRYNFMGWGCRPHSNQPSSWIGLTVIPEEINTLAAQDINLNIRKQGNPIRHCTVSVPAAYWDCAISEHKFLFIETHCKSLCKKVHGI